MLSLTKDGDNLKALKALLPTYAGKIKCIYIDPPYNTGNENWVYNDNVSSPMMQEWLDKVVDKEDFTRHDKWLCMMMPRLKLLRDLLKEDGVIFVSVDDNEQHRFRILMDEVFGEENFIANIIWQKKYSPQNDANYFSDMHDFIVVYAKKRNDGLEKVGWVRNLIPRTEEQNARYKNPEDDKLKEGLGGTFSYFELARYVYYTATGEEFDPEKLDEERNFIGESKDYEVYLFYKPDIEYLRTNALTLDKAKNLGEYKNKKRLVFAPSKYLDHDYLLEFRIDYCQLPFESDL